MSSSQTYPAVVLMALHSKNFSQWPGWQFIVPFIFTMANAGHENICLWRLHLKKRTKIIILNNNLISYFQRLYIYMRVRRHTSHELPMILLTYQFTSRQWQINQCAENMFVQKFRKNCAIGGFFWWQMKFPYLMLLVIFLNYFK